jgi:2-keto-4-pentenoate hydratase/2-oxohepta-3-ene-1,7-dioic acid hydratase in catechol pathway
MPVSPKSPVRKLKRELRSTTQAWHVPAGQRPGLSCPDSSPATTTTSLSGSGSTAKLKPDGNTSEIIFDAEQQIEYVSQFMTLEPGDVIVTGTCGGVGQGTNTFLKPGDVVETEIGPLGRQRNRVVDESLA